MSDREQTFAVPIEHIVTEWGSQHEGMTPVSGWKVSAVVTAKTGRKFVPVTIAYCPDEDAANEIAELLNKAYSDV